MCRGSMSQAPAMQQQQQQQQHQDTAQLFQLPGAPSSNLLQRERSGVLLDQLQRERVKLFARGDRVEIFSDTAQEWMLDGEVVAVVRERCTRDGLSLRAGSTKVVYGNGRRYKWLSPCMLEETVKALPLPSFPAPVAGELSLATQAGWFQSPQQRVHVELSKGFLQWWKAEEDAKLGRPAVGSISLMNSVLSEQGLFLKVQIGDCMGAVCALEAASLVDASRWAKAMKQHVEFSKADGTSTSNSNSCDVVF